MSALEVFHPNEVEAVLASGAWLPGSLPIVGPAPGTVDLVSSARTVTGDTDGGVRWIQGFVAVSDACGGSTVLDPCDFTPDEPSFGGWTFDEYLPYAIVAGFQCSTFGARSDELAGSARALLGSGLGSTLIERQFWGVAADTVIDANPTLLGNGALISGTFTPQTALAELEQAARETAPALGRYMIHASPRLASLWTQMGSIRKVGSNLVTYLDTIVVAGAGYQTGSGGGLATLTAGDELAFVTGIVTVHLADFFPQSDVANLVDRTSNTIVASAARFAAASYPPCLPPQAVTVTVAGSGGNA